MSCNVFLKVTCSGGQGQGAAQPVRLPAVLRTCLLGLQPSPKWCHHWGHRSPDLCLVPTLLKSPTPLHCPSCVPHPPTSSSAIHSRTTSPGTPRSHWVTCPRTRLIIGLQTFPALNLWVKTWSWAHVVPSVKDPVPCLINYPLEAFTLKWHDYCRGVIKDYLTQGPLTEGSWRKRVSVLSPGESCAYPGHLISFYPMDVMIKNCQPDCVPFLFSLLKSLVPNMLITSSSFTP